MFQFPSFSSILVKSLLITSLIVPSQFATAQNTATKGVITSIDRSRLKRDFSVAGATTVSEGGLRFSLGKKAGLSQAFTIAVHASQAQALEAWETKNIPEAARAIPLQGIGENVHAWSDPSSAIQQISFRRLNVIVAFGWNGPLNDAVLFAKKLDKSLETDTELAPRGGYVPVPKIDVVVPTLVVADEIVPLIYRTQNSALVGLIPLAMDTVQNEPKKVPVEIEATADMNVKGRSGFILKQEGKHTLDVGFVNYQGVLFYRKIDLNVVAALQQSTPSPWILPEKGIYLLPSSTAKWEETAPEKREEILFQEHRLVAFPLEFSDEADQWRIRAWNDLTKLLPIDRLPSIEQIQVFRNKTVSPQVTVAYAAYQLKDCRILVVAEVGKQFWLYIEQPQPLSPETALLKTEDLLNSDVKKLMSDLKDNPSPPQLSIMSKDVSRYRALSPNSKFEQVHVIHMHIGQSSQVQLGGNKYLADEKTDLN